MFIQNISSAEIVPKEKPKKIKLKDGIELKQVFDLLSNGLNEDVKELKISEIIAQINRNGDENITDKEIAKWLRNNLNEDGKDALPAIIQSKIMYYLAVELFVKNNDRSSELSDFFDFMQPLGGDCQLKTILSLGNTLLLKA